jgi:hypothetical protein
MNTMTAANCVHVIDVPKGVARAVPMRETIPGDCVGSISLYLSLPFGERPGENRSPKPHAER